MMCCSCFGSGSDHKGVEAKSSDGAMQIWSCSACTGENGAALRACQWCSTERRETDHTRAVPTPPAPAASTSSSQPQPAAAAASSSASASSSSSSSSPYPDWACPLCTALNPLRATQCRTCHSAQRPAVQNGHDFASLAQAVALQDAATLGDAAATDGAAAATASGASAAKRLIHPRNRHVTGTFNDHTFQCSLKPAAADPLQVPVFDALGYHCIPQLGCCMWV